MCIPKPKFTNSFLQIIRTCDLCLLTRLWTGWVVAHRPGLCHFKDRILFLGDGIKVFKSGRKITPKGDELMTHKFSWCRMKTGEPA